MSNTKTTTVVEETATVAESLENAVLQMLHSTMDTVGSASDFLSGEIPTYIQELLMWHGIYSAIWFIIGLLWCGFVYYFGVIKLKPLMIKDYQKDSYSNWDGSEELFYSIIIFCVCLISLWIMIDWDWLQIIVAPRVFLVEYASELIK